MGFFSAVDALLEFVEAKTTWLKLGISVKGREYMGIFFWGGYGNLVRKILKHNLVYSKQ